MKTFIIIIIIITTISIIIFLLAYNCFVSLCLFVSFIAFHC